MSKFRQNLVSKAIQSKPMLPKVKSEKPCDVSAGRVLVETALRKFKGFARNDDRHVKFEVSVSPFIYGNKLSKFIFVNH